MSKKALIEDLNKKIKAANENARVRLLDEQDAARAAHLIGLAKRASRKAPGVRFEVVVRPEGVATAYKFTAHSTQLVAVIQDGALSWVDVRRTHAGHGNACSMLRVRAYRREGFKVPKSWTVGGGSALHPASVR